jgi:hypothetical protein
MNDHYARTERRVQDITEEDMEKGIDPYTLLVNSIIDKMPAPANEEEATVLLKKIRPLIVEKSKTKDKHE